MPRTRLLIQFLFLFYSASSFILYQQQHLLSCSNRSGALSRMFPWNWLASLIFTTGKKSFQHDRNTRSCIRVRKKWIINRKSQKRVKSKLGIKGKQVRKNSSTVVNEHLQYTRIPPIYIYLFGSTSAWIVVANINFRTMFSKQWSCKRCSVVKCVMTTIWYFSLVVSTVV